ncbi:MULTISPECIES: hypothetical protein [Vagococcus]|uniref:hypothetical protein n=1 Tax=Vagococcus TaxID=2737 RepID=UPI002FCC6B85
MKKFFSLLVMLAIVAGGGYFVFNEFVKTKTPDVVAKDTGSIAVEEINDEEFAKIDGETKELLKKYDLVESYDSFEELNKTKQEDESYLVSKYEGKKLTLVSASKQKDGTVVAIFEELK